MVVVAQPAINDATQEAHKNIRMAIPLSAAKYPILQTTETDGTDCCLIGYNSRLSTTRIFSFTQGSFFEGLMEGQCQDRTLKRAYLSVLPDLRHSQTCLLPYPRPYPLNCW